MSYWLQPAACVKECEWCGGACAASGVWEEFYLFVYFLVWLCHCNFTIVVTKAYIL